MRISDWSSDVCSSDLVDNVQGITVGEDGEVHRFTGLVIGHDGRIVEVLKSGGKSPKGVDYRVDGAGQVMLPGMIDAHLHVMGIGLRSEEHTSELQSLMRISYAAFCLKKKNTTNTRRQHINTCLKIHIIV